ncbi:MAG: hypothetical protein JO099_09515 [Acidobacteriia bacterium]|nr:hypothetical protein [Terriglobia bacterium]
MPPTRPEYTSDRVAETSFASELGPPHLTDAKLVDRFQQLAALVNDLDCLFALHVAAKLVL